MRATGRSRSRSLIEEALSATRETKTIELKKDVLAMANSGGSPDTAILQGAARHWIIHSREPDRCGLVWPPISYQRRRSAPSTAHLPPQKLTVLDSEIKLISQHADGSRLAGCCASAESGAARRPPAGVPMKVRRCITDVMRTVPRC